MRAFLRQFLKGQKSSRHPRAVGNTFVILDKTSKREESDRAVRRARQFNTSRRLASGDIKSFWIRCAKLMGDAQAVVLTITPAIVYTRALAACPSVIRRGRSSIGGRSVGRPPMPHRDGRGVSIRLLRRFGASGILHQQTADEVGELGREIEQVYVAKVASDSRNRQGLRSRPFRTRID